MRRTAIIVLTLATASIHISFFLSNPADKLIMLLNGLGYLGLLALLYLPLGLPAALHRLVRPALIGFSALTIALYVFFSIQLKDWSLWLGPIDKAIEIAAIALLWSEGRAETGRSDAANPVRSKAA